jgi:hypothetical protein
MILCCRDLKNQTLAKFFGLLRMQDAKSEVNINSSQINQSGGFHFTSVSIEELSMIDVETLETTLSDIGVQIKSEDWLLHANIELGPLYFGLLRFVRYGFLSQEGMSHFLDHFDYPSLTGDIWFGTVRWLRSENDSQFQKQRFC